MSTASLRVLYGIVGAFLVGIVLLGIFIALHNTFDPYAKMAREMLGVDVSPLWCVLALVFVGVWIGLLWFAFLGLARADRSAN